MAASVKQNSDSATVTDGIATQASKEALDGGQAVGMTVDAMNSIATKIISRLETMPDAELNLKLISDLHGLQPLVRILDEKY